MLSAAPLHAGGQGCSPNFTSSISYPCGSNPNGLTIGDLDGDGLPDIIVANSGDSTLSILRGDGFGAFSPGQVVAVGTSPTSIAIVDLNRDGLRDLVSANLNGGSLTILLNSGNASNGGVLFSAPIPVAVASSPFTVVPAFLNGDGVPDLVVGHFGSNTLTSLIGNGDGSFQAPRTQIAGQSPISLALVDLNGDSRLDVATANLSGSTLSTLLGNGDGSLQAAVSLSVGTSPRSVLAADVNADGKLDLISVNAGTGNLQTMLGNGNGVFQPPLAAVIGIGPQISAVADMNSDGRPDVVVPITSSQTFGVLVCNGNGTYASPVLFPVGDSPQAVAVGDFNLDGRPDVAVLRLAGIVSVSLNTTPLISFVSQPTSVTTRIGLSASLGVTCVGPQPLTYQWRRNGVPLSPTGPAQGSRSPQLHWPLITDNDDGVYDVVVAGPCGSSISSPAYLAVSICQADLTGDNTVSVQDLFDFLTLYFAGCP